MNAGAVSCSFVEVEVEQQEKEVSFLCVFEFLLEFNGGVANPRIPVLAMFNMEFLFDFLHVLLLLE